MATDVFTFRQVHNISFLLHRREKKGFRATENRGIYKDKYLNKGFGEILFVLWSENLGDNGLLSDNN